METKTDKTIATEIARQLGNKAMCMLGAKNFSCTNNMFCFKIGKNCKRVNYIKITLNGLDLYDMEFIRIHGAKMTKLAKHTDIYADMMHQIIETETGMYTSL